MDVFCCTLLLLLHFHTTDGVQCFSRFIPSTLTCEGVIGEVDPDACCLNPKYGYQTEDGSCHSCGPSSWTRWSKWSQCTTLCGEGVRLRKRSCYGISQSECATGATLQAEACNGTCCDGEGWSPWSDWSACSVSCGQGGVKHRLRKCSDRPECALACTGSSEETEACPVHHCPVHGGWSMWSNFSECSGSCIYHHGNIPTRVRHRSCVSPRPSEDPPGNACQGISLSTQQCTALPYCAVNGGWGPWSEPGPCSVSCGEGLQLSHRSCDQPPPQYGGRHCEGPSTRASVCKSPCPVLSFWTGWSDWSECSATCLPDTGSPPLRTRQRFCITPGGSSEGCEGPTHMGTPCPGLNHCQVHGSWGPWSDFSPCSVTCGVGLQMSTRFCNNPPPKHGGQGCQGDASRYQICNTQQQCPVDGVWSEWSSWGPCQDVFDDTYSINCEDIGGRQRRQRICLHRALGGAPCPVQPLSESRACYDVDGCVVGGQWDGWEPWSQCEPPCGVDSKRSRRKRCKPDYSKYSPTIGIKEEPATFFGEPRLKCGTPATETQNCVNVPPC